MDNEILSIENLIDNAKKLSKNSIDLPWLIIEKSFTYNNLSFDLNHKSIKNIVDTFKNKGYKISDFYEDGEFFSNYGIKISW